MGVSSCCGCCSLKAGVVIIGALNIIGSVLLIFDAIFKTKYGLFLPVHAIVNLVCGILLIIGVNKRKSEYIFPTVCFSFASIVLVIPHSLFQHLMFAVFVHAKVEMYVIPIIAHAILFAFCVYIFMVVNSFYKQLLREKYAVSKIDTCVNMHSSNNHHHQHV